MDKLTDKIAALPADANYVSLEFFPPKTQQGFTNLHARLSRMAQTLRPLFVNVTWGAGGSTSSKSLALAELTQRELGLTTCLHLTCTNMSRKLIDEALDGAKALGVRNILALRGDPPRTDEYRDDGSLATEQEDNSNDEFMWAEDLVRYIRKQYGDFFCIGVAGYPEGHADQSHPEKQSVEHDLPYLVRKTRAGADFIMTQLFFDVCKFQSYQERLRGHESGVFKDIPIIPGLMPIQSFQILRRTTKLSHASLPTEILKRLEAVKSDDEEVKRVGVDILGEIVDTLKATPSVGPRGFHFYTLNLEKVVAHVLQRSGLIPPTPVAESAVSENGQVEGSDTENQSDSFLIVENSRRERKRRASSRTNSQPSNRVIVSRERASSNTSYRAFTYEAPEDEAGVPKVQVNSHEHNLAISEGEGSLGREATWDDFPNGRWGDARSPAYGEMDGYGVSLHVSVPEAKRLWGNPTTTEDISAIFRDHLEGRIDAMPWSEEALQPETLAIKPQLLGLIQRGWWTVASQPAVAGCRSQDPVFGWGPKNGFVFQKPFVEFFLPSADWRRLRPRLDEDSQVTYFAGNASGEFIASAKDSVNPVTWGTFAGKEIITPTIIEAVSFKAWTEEAFGIWAEWQRVYKPGSESSRLLERVRKDYWLVNVIHHEFFDGGTLWEGLIGAK